MNRLKHSSLFRVISLALIAAFIALDIAYAYPPEHDAANYALATPPVGQVSPVNEKAAEIQKSIRWEHAVITSIHDIAEYYFGNPERGIGPLPMDYVRPVIDADLERQLSLVGTVILGIVPIEYVENKEGSSEEFDTALKAIGFKGNLPKEGVIFILYKRGDKKFLVQIAEKERVLPDNLPGYPFGCSDKYIVKCLPQDYDGSNAAEMPTVKPAVEITASASSAGGVDAGEISSSPADSTQSASGGNGAESEGRRTFIASVSPEMLVAVGELFISAILSLRDFAVMHPIISSIVAIVLSVATVSLMWRKFSLMTWHMSQLGRGSAYNKKALIDIGAPAIPHLIKALESRDNRVCVSAKEVLEGIGETAIPTLQEALKDKRSSVRRSSAAILKKLNRLDQAQEMELHKRDIRDDDKYTRALAAVAIGRMGAIAREAIPDLKAALIDEDYNVRAGATDALDRLGEFTEELELMRYTADLRDGDKDVRRRAAAILLRIGDGRLGFMKEYLNLVKLKTPEYYEILNRDEIDIIINGLKSDTAIVGKYVPYTFHTAEYREVHEQIIWIEGQKVSDSGLPIRWETKSKVVVDSKACLILDIDKSQGAENLYSINPWFVKFFAAAVYAVKDFAAVHPVVAASIGAGAVILAGMVWREFFPINWHWMWARLGMHAEDNLEALARKGRPAIPILIKGLRDKDDLLRMRTLRAIDKAHVVNIEVVKILISLLEDRDLHVRREAYKSIENLNLLTDELKIKRFKVDVEDDNKYVRRFAAKELYGLNALALDIETRFCLADIADEEEDVRKAAAKRLSDIGDERLLSISEYLVTVGFWPSRYYEILSQAEVRYILTCLKYGREVKGQYSEYKTHQEEGREAEVIEPVDAKDFELGLPRGLTFKVTFPAKLRSVVDVKAKFTVEMEASDTSLNSAMKEKSPRGKPRWRSGREKKLYDASLLVMGVIMAVHYVNPIIWAGSVAALSLLVWRRFFPVNWHVTWLKMLGNVDSCLDALAMIGTPAAITVITNMLADKDSYVRERAIVTLGEVGPEAGAAIPGLMRILGDMLEDEWIRENAARALSRIGKAAVPALMRLMENGDSYVYDRASEAIGNIGPDAKEAAPLLIKTVEDENTDVLKKCAVIAALGRIGPATPEVIPVLIRTLGSGNNDIHNKAVSALYRIGVNIDPLDIAGSQFISSLAGALNDNNRASRLGSMEVFEELGLLTIGDTVEKYIFDLRSDDGRKREVAIEALGDIGPYAEKAAPLLVGVLKNKDSDASFRRAAASSLGRIGPVTPEVVPALIAALGSDDGYFRDNVVSALSHIGSKIGELDGSGREGLLQLLTEALGNSDNLIRMGAAVVLQKLSIITIANRVKKYIADLRYGDEHSREMAAEALGEIGPEAEDAVPFLVNALRDKYSNVFIRRKSAIAIGKIGPAIIWKAAPALRKALVDSDSGVRQSAAMALGMVHKVTPEAIPALRDAAVKDISREVRISAAESLGKIGFEAREAAVSMVDIIRDGSNYSFRRANALEALGRIGQIFPQIVPTTVITKVAEDIEGDVRESAIEALGRIGGGTIEIVNILKKALRDPYLPVRLRAAEALGRIGPKAKNAVPDLIRILSDLKGDGGDERLAEEFRNNAVYALGLIEPLSLEVISALRGSLRDSSVSVRLRAAEALGKMGGMMVSDVSSMTMSQYMDFWSTYRKIVLSEDVRPAEWFNFVKFIVPESMPNLRAAIKELEPLPGQGVSYDRLAVEMVRVIEKYELSRKEIQILWFALAGTGAEETAEPQLTVKTEISETPAIPRLAVNGSGQGENLERGFNNAEVALYLSAASIAGASLFAMVKNHALIHPLVTMAVGVVIVVVLLYAGWRVFLPASWFVGVLRNKDNSDSDRKVIKQKLAALGESVNPLLKKLLEDEDYYVRKAASEILEDRGLLTPKLKSRRYLIDLRDWSNRIARQDAVKAFSEMDNVPSEAINDLIEGAADDENSSSRDFIIVLRKIWEKAKIGQKEEIANALILALGSEREEVREAAKNSLIMIGRPICLPLLELLDRKDADKIVLRAAAEVLQKVSPAAKKDISSLMDLLEEAQKIVTEEDASIPVEPTETGISLLDAPHSQKTVYGAVSAPHAKTDPIQPLETTPLEPDLGLVPPVQNPAPAVRLPKQGQNITLKGAREDIMEELKDRKEIGFEDLFKLVQSRIPETMRNLRNALSDVEQLSRQKDINADAIGKAVAEAAERHKLFKVETEILELALLGPGQGGGAPVAEDRKVPDPQVTHIYEMVESSLNGRRTGLLESGDRKQLETDAIVVSLIVLARRAKWEGQKLIIGLETDWIPGMKREDHSLQKGAITPLIDEIDTIKKKLNDMGLDNVELVLESGADLAKSLRSKAKETDTDLHNIVVLASCETIDSESFKLLLWDADETNRPFLAGVDPKEIKEAYDKYGELESKQIYIRLTQMLYLTLELAVGGRTPPNMPWIDYKNKERKIIFRLPAADLIDSETLRERYNTEKSALAAA